MRVEKYSDLYFLDVVRLVEKFHKEYLTEFFGESNLDILTETIMTHADNTYLLLNDESKCVGVLAGIVVDSKLSFDRFFQEIIWYVEKPFGSFGFFMIDELQKMLKSLGFTGIIMSILESPKSDKVKKIYVKKGFKPMEEHFLRKF